jgi:hypothetical protein
MNKRKILILGVILLVVCGVCSVVVAMASYSVNQEDQTYGAVSEACFGSPVPDAAAYAATSGIHPAVGMKLYGTHYSTYNYPLPDNAVAASVSDAQVVFCLGDQEKVLLESCPYEYDSSGTPTHVVERSQYELTIKLFEAKTGILIAEETLIGKAPRKCLDEQFFSRRNKIITIDGEEVSDADIQAWLRPYIIIP